MENFKIKIVGVGEEGENILKRFAKEENPNVEIAAWDGEHFLRYYGVANLDKQEEIAKEALSLMPEVAQLYKANGWEMGIFYLDNATAEIRNMMEIEETYEFNY